MAILEKKEIEIPLNGGMDVKQGTELQSANTLRLAENLRWNKLGELERRPATATSAELDSADIGGVYTSEVMSGVYSRGDEVFALSQDHGVVSLSPDGADLTFMHRVNEASPDAGLKYAPQSAEVSRRFVARISGKDEPILSGAATAVYEGNQVIAWTTIGADLSLVLHCKVIDLATGTTVMAEQTHILTTATLFSSLSAIPITEVSLEGALVSVGFFNGAHNVIWAYRWDAATNEFALYGVLANNIPSTKHALVTDGTSVYFAYTNNAGFLVAYVGTLLGGLALQHTATHGALGGVAIVLGSTRALLVSINGASVIYSANLYAEVLGTPAGAITLRAITGTAGTDRFSAVHATLETRSGITNAAVVFATGAEELDVPDSRFVSAHVVNFTATTPVELVEKWVPHVACVGAATVEGRAYGVFALIQDAAWATISAPTSLVVARAAFPLTSSTDPLRLDPVARVCHERFARLTYDYGDDDGVVVVGSAMHFAMTGDPVNGYPQTLFTAKVDLTPRPMSQVELTGGVAVFGHGLLHSYDGDRPSEAQPISRPRVGIVAGLVGPGAHTGVISVIAVHSWIDAAGNLHRSEPSAAVTETLNTQDFDVLVSCPPFTSYDGALLPIFTQSPNEITCELYITELDGSDYYRASASTLIRHYDSKTAKDLWFEFEDVQPGVASSGDAKFPPVYTTQAAGEERASKPPPAFRAVTRVGDLLWAIDAEDPSRIWPSKPLVAGYAPEWNTLNTLFIGDNGVGISDVNGVPTIFAERGIWQVYGEGPNALGVGSFAPARRLPHEVECLDGLSVCKTGAGVFFRGRRGVYLLDTSLALQPVGLSVDPDMLVSGTPEGNCRIVYDELSNEVHVLDFGEAQPHYVFNLLENKWSKWAQATNTSGQWWKDARVVRGRVYALHSGESADAIKRIYAIDEDDYRSDDFYGWDIETPWYHFDGATGQLRVWEIVVQLHVGASVSGQCGGPVTVEYFTRDGETNRFVWQPEAIDELKSGDGTTVNLCCHIAAQRTRHFRLEISSAEADYAYEGHKPIALRVLFGITPRGARKTSALQGRGNTPAV